LAYCDCPILTGPLEGTNNKIKTMKQQAYGFRGKEFFILKIMGIQLTKYAFAGKDGSLEIMAYQISFIY
jgi:hypothetical protein